MTDRDDDRIGNDRSGDLTEGDITEGDFTDGDITDGDVASERTGEISADPRELADAVRDTLAARAAEGGDAFEPVRSRPTLPRALDTRPIEPLSGDTESRSDAERSGTDDHGDADGRSGTDGPGGVGEQSVDELSVAAAESAAVEPAAIEPSSVEPAPDQTGIDEAAVVDVSTDASTTDAEATDPEATDAGTTDPRAIDAEATDAAVTDAVPVDAEPVDDEPSSFESSADVGGEPVPVRRRFTGRGAIAVGARAASGLIGIAVAVAAIVGATVIPGEAASVPPVVTVDPVPAAQQRVCPGPLLRLGDDEGQGATIATSFGDPAERFQASPQDAEASSLADTENTAGVAPLLLTLPPGSSGDGPAAVAGSQSQVAASGDLVGYAAAECAEPSGDTWLVGGSTDVGRTTLITMSNPTTVIATVDISIFGPAGEVVAPGTEGIVVPPGAQRIFSLAGFAPQLESPVVRVQSRGGLVVADLQQSTVRTLEPGGVDMVAATASPSRTTVIPGVVIGNSAGIAAAQGSLDFDDLQTSLRLFLPGTDAATATVLVEPSRGTRPTSDVTLEADPGASAQAGFDIELIPGEVTDVPLPGLGDGTYTIAISSTAAIVAGARISTIAADGGNDFAWLPAASALQETTLVSVAPGPGPVLNLVNPSGGELTVSIAGVDDPRDVVLAAGEAVPVPVAAGDEVTLGGASGVLATVTYLGDAQVSAFGVTSPGPASSDIRVVR